MRCELAQAPERSRRDSENSTSRAVCAALVAGGLAFTVSLYPLPEVPQVSGLIAPVYGPSVKSARVVETSFLNRELSESLMLNVQDLVRLAALNDDPTSFATSDLVDLVMAYGLPDVVRALEFIQSYSYLAQSLPSYSGGDYSSEPSGIPLEVWPGLLLLIQYLQENLPNLSSVGLLDVITTFLAAAVPSLDITQTRSATPLQIQSAATNVDPIAVQAAASSTPDPAATTPTDYSIAPSVDLTVPPVTEAVVVPVTEVDIAPTTEISISTSVDAASSTHAEAPSSPPVEPSETNPEPSNSSAPESNSPEPESPSSPAGGGNEDSTGDNGAGPSENGGDNGPSDHPGGDASGDE